MSDEAPETPYRDARDPKRIAERDFDEVEPGSENAPSDIERAAEPSPRDPEMDMNYTHDDPDRQRDGLRDVPFMEEFEDVARRDELIRQLDDTVATARSWAEQSKEPDAQEIVDLLVEASDRLGQPTEETSIETTMDRSTEDTSGV